MKITMSSYGRFLGLFLKYYCPHIFSGDICVAKKLDREMVEGYSLVITATDGGNKVCNDIQNTPFSVSFFPFSPLLNGAGLLIPLVEGFLNNFGFDFAPFLFASG